MILPKSHLSCPFFSQWSACRRVRVSEAWEIPPHWPELSLWKCMQTFTNILSLFGPTFSFFDVTFWSMLSFLIFLLDLILEMGSRGNWAKQQIKKKIKLDVRPVSQQMAGRRAKVTIFCSGFRTVLMQVIIFAWQAVSEPQANHYK